MTPIYRALVMDDDDDHNETLCGVLAADLTVDVVHTPGEVERALQENDSRELLLLCLCLDVEQTTHEQCLELLTQPALRDAEVILMARGDEPELAHRAIRRGAIYFFCKPVDGHFLSDLVADLIADAKSQAEPEGDAVVACAVDQFALLRGSSRVMKKLYRRLRKVADTEATVLITGESGTGKELVAQSIHELSARRHGPFLAVNCGAISPELVESELFGHVKGAFSGATRQHQGFFQRACGGTLFLDEVAEMPLELQVKLLRVLESRHYRLVGGESDNLSDVRIVAAMNRDPEQAVREAQLREDLYYRLAQFPIAVPPLRNRGEDIVGLAQYFVNTLNEEQDSNVSIEPDAFSAIVNHQWPGNVRELKNAIAHAFIMADRVITASDLPDLDNTAVGSHALTLRVGETIDDAERKLILATLEANDGDKPTTAQTLGISLKTLYNRLNAYEESETAFSKQK